MTRTLFRLASLSLCISLAGCSWFNSSGGSASSSSSSSVARSANYTGILQKSGINSVAGGTHFVALEEGGVVALESELIDLDSYIDAKVRVSGLESLADEGYPMLSVTRVDVLEEALPDLGAEESSSSSSSSSETSSFSSVVSSVARSSVATRSAAASSVSRASSSSLTSSSVSSSSSSVAVSDAPAASASSAASSVDIAARTQVMAKAAVNASTFTGQYCSTHMSFCVPVHKSWYYTSFGGSTSTVWHVEVGPVAVENVGEGPITVDLVSGPAPSGDGAVTTSGDFVIGYRAWTNGRHFAVKGPAALRAAVEFMTQNIATADAPVQ